jgi:hypothetical protein
MRIFVELVNFTAKNKTLFKPEELGCDGYYTLLRSQLEKWSSSTGTLPDPNSPTESDKFYFLSHDVYENIVRNTPKHVVYPLALRYLELAVRDSSPETVLFHPYRSDVTALLAKEFLPSLTVIRLHNELLRARDTLMHVNPALKDMRVPIMPEVTYSEYLREVMKKKDLAYSLFTDLNNYLEHNCHHQGCPYYPTNLCRRWSAIPQQWAKCPFPPWFATVVERSIDSQTGELKKIPKTVRG